MRNKVTCGIYVFSLKNKVLLFFILYHFRDICVIPLSSNEQERMAQQDPQVSVHS